MKQMQEKKFWTNVQYLPARLTWTLWDHRYPSEPLTIDLFERIVCVCVCVGGVSTFHCWQRQLGLPTWQQPTISHAKTTCFGAVLLRCSPFLSPLLVPQNTLECLLCKCTRTCQTSTAICQSFCCLSILCQALWARFCEGLRLSVKNAIRFGFFFLKRIEWGGPCESQRCRWCRVCGF